ncbi:DUF3604 domain-containing protein [Porphyrobacter sp. LM 6]|uniref:DUF3604 domain-containing protein n=1 Tax=Porphyrobacter sp. LM 6 TaxID=1896196 RepID=UPI00084686B4|nr:DUF3604 domain-containing protein [Porphyrobacter sp. LM 6]AOL93005.1 Protein of unknown function (DUF3604) [Porphyrobacter sp. LM 6]
MRKTWTGFAAASLMTIAVAGCSGEASLDPAQTGNGENTVKLAEFPDRPYWGDTHLHTDNSVDAFGFGVRLGPEDALRFARGEAVTATTGGKAQLDRPLDFLVIADHSDGMGATKRLFDAPRWYVKWVMRDDTVLRWYDLMHESPEGSQRAMAELITAAANGTLPEALSDPERAREGTEDLWNTQLGLLDRYNEPGVFTAFAGFEWTLMPDGNNLHRVVMFRDGSDKTRKTLPLGGIDTKVEQLWDYMEAYEKNIGGKVLAIPHNSNLSNGLMFEMTMADGSPMTAAYAKRRAAAEPVVEATQIKGDSETHPFLSPNDEMAGFGVKGWELGNLPLTAASTPDMYAGSYVRSALLRGLSLEAQLGVNPYAFGLIGSTDSHTGLATGDEDNFFGKHTGTEPAYKNRALVPQNLGTRQGRFGWHYLAGGYAAAWARGNTRAEIFDAFRRREVYATTGPRMTVRIFGGHDFSAADWAGDWVRAGYTRGVPMGGELTDKGSAPTFLISALKDPDGANLDRVQVVKGWIDASGAMQERVYDVVWSDMAKRPGTAKGLTPVGDTVDRKKATYTNSIGAPELRTTWTDPDYAKGQRAFYYVRVLEIPTPRWTLFDAVRFGFELKGEALEDAVAQERAYTSPIWLKPQGAKGTT